MPTIDQKLTRAVEKHKAGDFKEAEALYRDIVRIDSSHADALNLLGVASHQQKNFQTAVENISRAIQLNPSPASYHCNLGAAYRGLDQLEKAVECFREAIRINPRYYGAHYNLAMALEAQGDVDSAIESYHQTLQLNPQFVDAFNNLGNLLSSRGDIDEAIDCFRKALGIHPGYARAHYNLGNLLLARKKHEDAIESLRCSIQLDPTLPDAYNNLGLIFKELGRYEEAEEAFQKAIELDPGRVEAISNLGSVKQLQGDSDLAIKYFQDAIKLSPDNPDLPYNLTVAFQSQFRVAEAWDTAINYFQGAIKRSPDNSDLHFNLATAYQRLLRITDAIESYQRVLQINPDHAKAHASLGTIYEMEGQLELAEMHLAQSLEIDPLPHRRLQQMTMLKPVFDSSMEMFESRHQLKRNIETLRAEGFQVDCSKTSLSTCFYLTYQGCDDRSLLENLDCLMCSSHVSENVTAGEHAHGDGKIHVGFVSRYFWNHTIGRLMRGMIAELSRDDFHVTVLTNQAKSDEIANFIRDQADEYVDLTEDMTVALQKVDDQKLDVLFYADLGMDPMTYALAHHRLAPVQCVTWGHPTTTGMDSIDYFLSSRLLEVDNAQDHYSEQLVQLDTLPTYYYRPRIEAGSKTRRDFGLPDEGTIYLCPQSLFKIHPDFDAILAEILRRDPNGFIVFADGLYPNWTKMLKQRFERTIPSDNDRILFVARLGNQEFHQMLRLADVMLDPIHFGGGNTTYEAMAFGVPLITLPSTFMRGRLGYALYQKMNLFDCVADGFSEYVDLCVSLGTNPVKREEIHNRILESNGVLFEDDSAVRQTESFLKAAVAKVRNC